MIRLKIILGAIVMFLSLNSCSSDDERDEDNQLRSDLYFGVNMSGVEFAAVYPGIDGTHYGYPSRDDLAYVKKERIRIDSVSIPLGTYSTGTGKKN